ncbi:hypothetical protein [Helicobacter bilis]|uniref:hypothetical protein n=1 Tax=Helicobacter bilis TaxID=37372 RepID=UPI0026F1AE1B|nr:hypothetical protein [Helicobacter bilis]MCI7410657.1 hypothetical protein [Helicobacter bilis]MDD7295695.1 hypothetical protein [Helicobacter bilis]MDY4400138.1 hypothetical protein [Helicobacter bilis]
MAKVVVVSEKSAVLGLVINLLGLGFFGFDRYYKGDFILGTFKLIMGIFMTIGGIYFDACLLTDEASQTIENGNTFLLYSRYVIVGYAFLAVCDFILVLLGIIKDNAKKRAKLAMS